MSNPPVYTFPANDRAVCPRCLEWWDVGDPLYSRGYVSMGGYGLTHADCPRPPQRKAGDPFPPGFELNRLTPANRPNKREVEQKPCELCGNFYATVDMVIRDTGRVHISLCGQCALTGVQGDWDRLDEHAKAFGKGRLVRVRED